MSVPSPDDRDRVVDRLLRQTQDGAPSGPAPGPCLEADTLAAWSEGTLAATEVGAVEQHAAGCERCQALLATFVRADIPAVVEPAAESIWRRWHLAWVVPVATAATVASIWVAVPDRDRDQVTAPATPEVDALATAESQKAAPAVAPDATAEADEVATAKPEQAGPAAQESLRQAAAAQPPARAEAQAPAAEPQEERLDRALDQFSRPAPPEGRPPASPPAPAAARAAAPASAVPSSADADEPPARLRETTESFADETVAVQDASAALTRLPALPGAEIVSPDPAIRWRITAEGGVVHTTSGGAAWEPVAGLVPGLVAGSAPSAEVCWLVGAAGAVFRTTDGVAFERLPFPEPVELRAVTAIDEQTARVTAADGRTWRTADGGQTWE